MSKITRPQAPAGEPRPRLQGRRALVTGGATGIGRATVQRLAVEGADVVVNFVGDPTPADDLVRSLREAGTTAFAAVGDVSNEADVVAMFRHAQEQLGGSIDLLVNNAGIQKAFRLIDMPFEEWSRVLAVNLTGSFLCAREAARGLTAAGKPGVIINVSSVHEVIPWPQFSHYCASKGGMKLFSQTIARELAPARIRVVNVAPGAVLTAINEDLRRHPDKWAQVESEIPLGRMGKPEEIAEAISWLASAEADYVTGATLLIDGGMSLYPHFV
jgi:glucose 1-dehydrogenase